MCRSSNHAGVQVTEEVCICFMSCIRSMEDHHRTSTAPIDSMQFHPTTRLACCKSPGTSDMQVPHIRKFPGLSDTTHADATALSPHMQHQVLVVHTSCATHAVEHLCQTSIFCIRVFILCHCSLHLFSELTHRASARMSSLWRASAGGLFLGARLA